MILSITRSFFWCRVLSKIPTSLIKTDPQTLLPATNVPRSATGQQPNGRNVYARNIVNKLTSLLQLKLIIIIIHARSLFWDFNEQRIIFMGPKKLNFYSECFYHCDSWRRVDDNNRSYKFETICCRRVRLNRREGIGWLLISE